MCSWGALPHPPTALIIHPAVAMLPHPATNTADSLLDYSSNVLNAQDHMLLYVYVI